MLFLFVLVVLALAVLLVILLVVAVVLLVMILVAVVLGLEASDVGFDSGIVAGVVFQIILHVVAAFDITWLASQGFGSSAIGWKVLGAWGAHNDVAYVCGLGKLGPVVEGIKARFFDLDGNHGQWIDTENLFNNETIADQAKQGSYDHVGRREKKTRG